MRVEELMTKEVLTIGPEAPIKDVAKILIENGISGLPVCDIENRVLGVVSEGDILFKEHDPGEGRHGGPLSWLVEGRPDPSAYEKARALTARRAMTSPAITIAPYVSVAEAARLMSERGINRLPIVRNGKLVGIVTRGDLVRAFTRSDAEIEHEIREDVLERTLWIDRDVVDVVVKEGMVALSGRLNTKWEAELLCRLVARVPGVVTVVSAVDWDVDETSHEGRRALESWAR